MKSLNPASSNRQEMDSVSENDLKYPIKVATVDDDENDRLQMTREVDQSPDLESVGSFSSGLEALERIPSSTSQIVLLDVRMPGLSGIEVTKRLKDVRPGLFIFLISGFEDPHTGRTSGKSRCRRLFG